MPPFHFEQLISTSTFEITLPNADRTTGLIHTTNREVTKTVDRRGRVTGLNVTWHNEAALPDIRNELACFLREDVGPSRTDLLKEIEHEAGNSKVQALLDLLDQFKGVYSVPANKGSEA